MKLMHMYQLEAFSIKGQSEVIQGHRGQKVILTKKIIFRLYNIA